MISFGASHDAAIGNTPNYYYTYYYYCIFNTLSAVDRCFVIMHYVNPRFAPTIRHVPTPDI